MLTVPKNLTEKFLQVGTSNVERCPFVPISLLSRLIYVAHSMLHYFENMMKPVPCLSAISSLYCQIETDAGSGHNSVPQKGLL